MGNETFYGDGLIILFQEPIKFDGLLIILIS